MNKVVKKYVETNLIIRILIGLVVGTVLALLLPNLTFISVFGDVFVGALKAVAPVLVFVLVISSLANAKGGIGKKFRTVILLYMLSTFLAAFTAVIASRLFPVTLNFSNVEEAAQAAPTGIWEVLQSLLMNMVSNPIKAIGDGNYIGILTWAVIFGLTLKSVANDTTKNVLSCISDAVSMAVRFIIN